MITQSSRKHQANRYNKNLPFRVHLVSLLYGLFSHCNGLRERREANLIIFSCIFFWLFCILFLLLKVLFFHSLKVVPYRLQKSSLLSVTSSIEVTIVGCWSFLPLPFFVMFLVTFVRTVICDISFWDEFTLAIDTFFWILKLLLLQLRKPSCQGNIILNSCQRLISSANLQRW